MTELETLQRARMYMEKLANGINPIDDSVIPEAETVNNVRLSRCFFYVADVLRQVIENGGVTSQKQKKAVFSLSAERAASFPYSDVPLTISEIVKRINDLTADENMINLTTMTVTDWLVSVEALTAVPTAEGHIAKRPTAHGSMLGIRVEERSSENGPYNVVVYNREAQQFVLDHLDAAVELYRQKTENQGQPWSREDDACLQELFQSGADARAMAAALKRNGAAVRARLKKLGLTTPADPTR